MGVYVYKELGYRDQQRYLLVSILSNIYEDGIFGYKEIVLLGKEKKKERKWKRKLE